MSEFKDFLPDDLIPKNNNRPLDTILKGKLATAEIICKIKEQQKNQEFFEELAQTFIKVYEERKQNG